MAACTWCAHAQVVDLSGAGFAKQVGHGTAWGLIGSASSDQELTCFAEVDTNFPFLPDFLLSRLPYFIL